MISFLFSNSEHCTGESDSDSRKMCRPSSDSVSVSVFLSNGLFSMPNLSRLGFNDSDHRTSDLPLSNLTPNTHPLVCAALRSLQMHMDVFRATRISS